MEVRENQKQRVYRAFYGVPRTMLSVAYETGKERANVCRYVDEMRREGAIAVCRHDKDPITGCYADFFSTDEQYYPLRDKTRQLCLFDFT